MTIYVIAKSWFGGRFEPIEAYKNEDDARKEIAKLIPLTITAFNIIIFPVNLKE